MLPGFLTPPHIFLTLGVIALSVGVIEICIGVSFGGWRVVRRANEPKEFWWDVAGTFLIGVLFIGYFLYRLYELSR